MNTYVFLTNLLGGYSGGPSYVRNKKIWLERYGWNVIAFDSTGSKNTAIEYPELYEFQENRIEELFYHPSWYSHRVRERVINKIISTISKDNNKVIIESNTKILSEWGELIAERILAKHLIYLLGENEKIVDDNEYQYFYYKYKRNEIFSISSKAFESLFASYFNVEDANMHYWDAMSMTIPQNVYCKELDIIQKSDYTITHFGRFKNYVPNVVSEICRFADNHKNFSINVVFFGINPLIENLKQDLIQRKNVIFYQNNSVFPIPQKVFQISDVVIATAGCAAIAAEQGVKTVSYNVETNLPLGVMGYTTTQISYSDYKIEDTKQNLCEILEDVLLKKMYDYKAPLQLSNKDKGYNYHVSFINEDKKYFTKILKIDYHKSLNGIVQKILCKIGLVHIASLIRYYKSK